MNHIIHKQQVVLDIAQIEQSFNFQDRVSLLFRNELSKELDTLFETIAPSHQIVRIDSLQLNLGTLNAQNFEYEFKERFITVIEQEISKTKQEIVIQKNDAGQKRPASVVTQAESLRETLIYFLQSGSLPWYAECKKTQDWEAQILHHFSDAHWQFLAKWLQDNCRGNSGISQRLVFQFSNAFLEQIISKAAPRTPDAIASVFKDIHYLLTQYLQQKTSEARAKIWLHFLEYFLFKKEKRAPAFILIKLFVLNLSANQIEKFTSDVRAINQRVATKSVRHVLFNLLSLIRKNRNEIEKGKENKNEKGAEWIEFLGGNLVELLSDPRSVENVDRMDFDNEGHLKELLPRKEKPSANIEKGRKTKSTTPEDVFYVINSGVVILHPFLETYFTELGLMADKEFLNEDVRSRAVLLLHYLATGSEAVAEFNLAFQKILCGFPLEETLPSEIELTTKEKDESAKLLQTVTEYWPPLRNTSAEGLQTSFLQREGKLTLTENGWLVVIEQKTIDILLRKLPWGFSTIRLPWMKEIVSVEWC